MPRPIYRMLRLDTTLARTAELILPLGEKFDGLKVVDVPAGLNVELNWNGSTDNDHFVPMVEGDSVNFIDDCGNPFLATEGLTLRHNAVAGVLVLYISQGVGL